MDSNDDLSRTGVQSLIQKFQTSKLLGQNSPSGKSKPTVPIKPSFNLKTTREDEASPASELNKNPFYFPTPQPPGKVLQILHLKEHGFDLDKDAFTSVLSKVWNLPLVILSINGSCREGKSYILNYFVRYLKFRGSAGWFERELPPEEQFSWRSGRERTTVGINLYSDPFVINNGKEAVAVLLLDCQGLFDQHTTFEQNAVIYGLSNLISSVMIYNVKCKIEENLLQNIHYFSAYAKAITNEEAIEEERPHFVFLVRDFQFYSEYALGYHGEDRFAGDRNYYQDTMFPTEDVPKENVTPRRDIMSCYTNLGMFLMPHPGKEFLQNSVLNPPDEDFREQIRDFVRLIISPPHLVTKKIGGQQVTAEMLSPYIEIWGEEISSSASEFMRAETIAESTATHQNEVAAHGVIARFKQEFCQYLCSEHVGVEDDELHQYKDNLLDWAILTYMAERKLGGEALMQKYAQRIQETCTAMYTDTYFPLNAELRRRIQEKNRASAQYEVSMQANQAHIRKLQLDNDNLREKLAEQKRLDEAQEADHVQIGHFQAKARTILQREHKYFSHMGLDNITMTRNRHKKIWMAHHRCEEELREANEEKERLESKIRESYNVRGTWRLIPEDDMDRLSVEDSESQQQLTAVRMKIQTLVQKLEELEAALVEKKEKGRKNWFWLRRGKERLVS